MNIYRVGGAVRDHLLGFPFHETDWVVVGSTPENMLAAGYKQVGRDFPVFLHPKTKEEYALARTERKSLPGHHGFEVHAAPTVTLEEDLQRRDLTINAMAMDAADNIIDPYGGQTDLEARMLRHVSPHFIEDPLRVLRVARFAARYHHLGFAIADETMALMSEIVASNELHHLSAERIWAETEKALVERHPEVFWQILRQCGALKLLMPEVDVSAGIYAIARAAPLLSRTDCRWAALLADLPQSRAEQASLRLRAPNAFVQLASHVCSWRPRMKTALRNAEECAALLRDLDALRRAEPFGGFCETLTALEQNASEVQDAIGLLRSARAAAKAVAAADFVREGKKGAALGEAIRAEQIARINALLRQ